MNTHQLESTQPSFIRLRPDSPALLAVRHDTGRPSRQIRRGGDSAPLLALHRVADSPAPVPPRCHEPHRLGWAADMAVRMYRVLFAAVVVALILILFRGGAL